MVHNSVHLLEFSLLALVVIVDAGRVAEQIEHLKVLLIIAVVAVITISILSFTLSDFYTLFHFRLDLFIFFWYLGLIDLLNFRLFRGSFNFNIDHLFYRGFYGHYIILDSFSNLFLIMFRFT